MYASANIARTTLVYTLASWCHRLTSWGALRGMPCTPPASEMAVPTVTKGIMLLCIDALFSLPPGNQMLATTLLY